MIYFCFYSNNISAESISPYCEIQRILFLSAWLKNRYNGEFYHVNSIDANTKKPQTTHLKQLIENFWRSKLLRCTKNWKQKQKQKNKNKENVFNKESKELEGHKKS